MPKSIAPIEIRLAGRPSAYRPKNATSSDSGMTTATAAEPATLRRNSHTTPTTSRKPESRFLCTVDSVSPTRSLRS
jgi:hypothetical protein